MMREGYWGDSSHSCFHGTTRCLICGMRMELPLSFVLNGVTCTDCRLRQKRVVEECESENELTNPYQWSVVLCCLNAHWKASRGSRGRIHSGALKPLLEVACTVGHAKEKRGIRSTCSRERPSVSHPQVAETHEGKSYVSQVSKSWTNWDSTTELIQEVQKHKIR